MSTRTGSTPRRSARRSLAFSVCERRGACGRSRSPVDGGAGPGPELGDVVGRRPSLLRRVGQQAQVARRRQAALVGVEHVEPGEHVTVERLHAYPQLAVVVEGGPVPAVQRPLVALRDVVEHHEHPLRRVFDNGGARAFPADVLATEREPPALQPARAALGRVRAPLRHLRRVHVAAIRRVQRHGSQAYEPSHSSGGGRLGSPAADHTGRHATQSDAVRQSHISIVILGGGPGGYEAALVAAQLGAQVTVVDSDGLGGACVLTDCVPSKTLIATSETMGLLHGSPGLGIRIPGAMEAGPDWIDAPRVYQRVKALAQAQSDDVTARLAAEGVKVVRGRGRLDGPGSSAGTHVVAVGGQEISADVVLIATGGLPRVMPGAEPDGERILTWRQLYDLDELPPELIVVGSGVTGAEFASAYQALGSQVTLVSSRDRVLPSEDADAAMVVEDVFKRRGMTVLGRSRAAAAKASGDGVTVTLEDGRTVRGSHCLLTVGMVPNTGGLGLEQAGITLDRGGFIPVDRVSRTSAPGIYAAGDCTGVQMLASVAAMQGRIAMWHSLGEAVQPLRLSHVAMTVFTEPEIATVGVSQRAVEAGQADALVVKLPLATNARAKMQGFRDGFVKLFARRSSGMVLGGVVVAPRASELILGVSLAVEQHLTVDEIAHTFAVYPSLSGSITEAARRLMQPSEEDLI